MELIDAAAKVELYKETMKQIMPYKPGQDFGARDIMMAGGIEALTILDGDEDMLKICMEEAKRLSPTPGRQSMDTEQAYQYSSMLRALAYLVKK